MKAVKAKEMARIEQLAYAHGASEEIFMESAGKGVATLAQQCIASYHCKPNIILLCGSGNNGGDAFVAGRLLKEGGFNVRAFAITPLQKCSPLCKKMAEAFLEIGGTITFLNMAHEVSFQGAGLLIDGLLGTGFHGEITGIVQEIIEAANASHIPILAIDIPSGVNGTTGEVNGSAIQAKDTLFLGLPKTGCFLAEAWNYTGQVHTYNFGLEQSDIEQAQEDFFLLTEEWVAQLLPRVKRNQHKYQAGYVVGLGGTFGMPGAPILSSFAALRAGAGIVRLLHPAGMEAELAGAPLEVIREGYKEGDMRKILHAMERAAGLFIGPGFGVSNMSKKLLKKLIPHLDKPCVIDAEALTLLAEDSISFPSACVITPHHGEMLRLLRREKLPMPDLLAASQEFSDQHQVVVVLKGAPTFILHPAETPYVSPRGDPGMATAGSGDVLTGIIAAFLAQKKTPLEAALLGVYIHGMAGEIAAQTLTSYSMVASDITEALPEAFLQLSF